MHKLDTLLDTLYTTTQSTKTQRYTLHILRNRQNYLFAKPRSYQRRIVSPSVSS